MRPNVGRALLGGFLGTLVMTLIMYFLAPMMGLMKMDVAAGLAGMMHTSWAIGLLLHFINGSVIFPLVYLFLLYRMLPGSPAVKGILWGVILWFVAQIAVMPMMGAGVFSSRMGGSTAAIASLVNHAVYGALLGWIAGAPASLARVQQHPKAKAA